MERMLGTMPCSCLLLPFSCLVLVLSVHTSYTQAAYTTHIQATHTHTRASDDGARLPTATTPCGKVEGVWDSQFPGVAAFLGVPFAKQPVGPLRWRPAVGGCWPNSTTTFQAKKQPPACPQFRPRQGRAESESCLFLNVFTSHAVVSSLSSDPATTAEPEKLLPVLVWVFGGGSVYGSVQSYGDIQSVVKSMGGKVILVAINYRLGSFGYFALKELSNTDPRGVSGNYGISDVQEALRWVKGSIAGFGGDAKRVTVYGQSSGGTVIQYRKPYGRMCLYSPM